MNYQKEYFQLSKYETIMNLKEDTNDLGETTDSVVDLVREKGSNRLFVKKKIQKNMLPLYHQLQQLTHKGLVPIKLIHNP